jgi:hypothetical protein
MKTRNELNPYAILANVQTVLQQVQDFPQILDKLSAEDKNKFYGLIEQLQQQFSLENIQPEGLFIAANNFLTEIENKAEFRTIFSAQVISQEALQDLQESRKRLINKYAPKELTDLLNLSPMDAIRNSIITISEFQRKQQEPKEKNDGRNDEDTSRK